MRKKLISNLIFLGTLVICLVASGILSSDAKPHEKLEFEPINFKPPVPQKQCSFKWNGTIFT